MAKRRKSFLKRKFSRLMQKKLVMSFGAVVLIFVFLIGKSGVGKSSILKLLSRQEEVSGGRIFVDEQDIGLSAATSWTGTARRSRPANGFTM